MKKIFGLLFLGFIAFGLTACGPTPTPGPGPDQGDNDSETGGNTDETTSLDTIKGKFGDNFEITISIAGIIKTETVKRDGNIVHVVNSSSETLYYNGASYFKLGSRYELYEEITDYNAGNIVWNDTLVGSFMLEYTSAYFVDESGWSKSSATVLNRPATKYTLPNSCEVYIDNATGASFKFVGLNETTALANFEVTVFSQGNVDLSALTENLPTE